jgi:MFS family permease
MQTTSPVPSKRRKTLSLTSLLLLCGAIAGPFFIFVVLVQDYTRPGFDPRLDQLSLLSLGNWGWVQIANFLLAGFLNLLYAADLWRRLHPGKGGTWGPILIAMYGLGLVVVGIFRTDPSNGFPPGVPAATQPSWHGAIHALGALFVFLMLAAALCVFVRLFLAWQERWWAIYVLASAVLFLLIFFTGFTNAAFMARTLRLAVLIGWMAASLVAIKLLSTSATAQQDSRPREV